MDISSTTTASASSGFFSFRSNEAVSSAFHLTSSSRCSVLASRPVSSAIRLAARPVGAAMATVSPMLSSRVMMPRSVVVLPVPGPPVRISVPRAIASIIACRCCCSYLMRKLCSIASIRSSTSAAATLSMLLIACIRTAIRLSASCRRGKNKNSRSPNRSAHSSRLSSKRSTAASIGAASTPSSCSAAATVLSRGRQVWPLPILCRSTYSTPAARRERSSRSPFMAMQIASAFSKPMYSPGEHSR